MDQQTHDTWHAEILPDCEQTAVLNIKSRTIKIVQIVNKHIALFQSQSQSQSQWDLQFTVSNLFIDEVMYWIHPEICEKTRVQRTKLRTPITSLDKYKTVSRNRWNRNKPKILGNHFFAPLIFTHLYQFCQSHSNHLFFPILLEILTADVRLKQTRPQPLIPHTTLLMDNLFRTVCYALLKYHGIDGPGTIRRLDSNGIYIKQPAKAKDNHSQFLKCIEQINDNHRKIMPSFLMQQVSEHRYYRNSSVNYTFLVEAFIEQSIGVGYAMPIIILRLVCAYHHNKNTNGIITAKSDIWNENANYNQMIKTKCNTQMIWKLFDEDCMSDDDNDNVDMNGVYDNLDESSINTVATVATVAPPMQRHFFDDNASYYFNNNNNNNHCNQNAYVCENVCCESVNLSERFFDDQMTIMHDVNYMDNNNNNNIDCMRSSLNPVMHYPPPCNNNNNNDPFHYNLLNQSDCNNSVHNNFERVPSNYYQRIPNPNVVYYPHNHNHYWQ